MKERVTQKRLDETFADIRALPSYLQIAQAAGDQTTPGLYNWYHDSVEHVRDQIYNDFDATETQKVHVDRKLLLSIFRHSSHGSESRMVFTGFKPAAFIGITYVQRELRAIRAESGNIPVEYASVGSLIWHGIPNPAFGYLSQHNDVIPDPYNLSHSGFIYNKTAVEKVVQSNESHFKAGGYDVASSSDEIVKAVFTASDAWSQSILLGYSPYTSLTYYLDQPGDFNSWVTHDVPTNQTRKQCLRNMAQRVLTADQFSIADTLLAQPASAKALDLFGEAVMNEDYLYKTPRNLTAQSALAKSGIKAYVDDMRIKLGKTIDVTDTYL